MSQNETRAAVDLIAQAVRDRIAEIALTALTCGECFTTTTAEAAPALTPDRLRDMMRDWSNMAREARRNDVTFVVDLAHEGPITSYRHPTEGEFIECSHGQAQAIHERWPLVFKTAESSERALFRPAHQFDPFVLKVLPAPPYHMPEESGLAK